jgi:hypothetical protein
LIDEQKLDSGSHCRKFFIDPGDIGGFLITLSALTPKATTWFVEPVVEVWNAK